VQFVTLNQRILAVKGLESADAEMLRRPRALHQHDISLSRINVKKANMNKGKSIPALLSSDLGILITLALARILLQVFTNGQYGFHQDELVTLDAAAHHLAWGEETINHRAIYVCHNLREPWPEFWQHFQYFG
jgi:hypothetical protein